jgi:hypothetical protein
VCHCTGHVLRCEPPLVRKALEVKTEIRDASLDASPDFLLPGRHHAYPSHDDFIIRRATKHFARAMKPFFAGREEKAKP